MNENAACIFCRIVEGKEKASFVAQGSDAVAFLHPKGLQSRRPTIAAAEEFLVVQPQIAIHDGVPFGIELARAPREFERTQRGFHGGRITNQESDDLPSARSLTARSHIRRMISLPG